MYHGQNIIAINPRGGGFISCYVQVINRANSMPIPCFRTDLDYVVNPYCSQRKTLISYEIHVMSTRAKIA